LNPVATLTLRPIAGDGEFYGPSMDEFFPEILFNAFGVVPMHRIHLIQLLSVIAVVLIMWLGTRRMKVVPGRFQSLVEMGIGFVRTGIKASATTCSAARTASVSRRCS